MAFIARGQNILGRGQDLGILKRCFVCESGFAKDEQDWKTFSPLRELTG